MKASFNQSSGRRKRDKTKRNTPGDTRLTKTEGSGLRKRPKAEENRQSSEEVTLAAVGATFTPGQPIGVGAKVKDTKGKNEKKTRGRQCGGLQETRTHYEVEKPGAVLIINNIKFDGRLEERTGAQHDSGMSIFEIILLIP